MATKIFVNLPVNDLNKSIEFFTKLGFTFNPKFTDENATCMIIGENIFAMLVVQRFFKTFINKEISDATKTTEAIIALTTESREKVDELVYKAMKAGATASMPSQDHGWMYVKSFQDLDGHMWEVFYMDEAAIPKQ